ncbi:MAG TPA: hypothetical protein VFO60_03285 [Candidatus Dormibacteraeota bacterium]|nr:hypothetical protein [Candidatus Dormibacteraeota bacterium]
MAIDAPDPARAATIAEAGAGSLRPGMRPSTAGLVDEIRPAPAGR